MICWYIRVSFPRKHWWPDDELAEVVNHFKTTVPFWNNWMDYSDPATISYYIELTSISKRNQIRDVLESMHRDDDRFCVWNIGQLFEDETDTSDSNSTPSDNGSQSSDSDPTTGLSQT